MMVEDRLIIVQGQTINNLGGTMGHLFETQNSHLSHLTEESDLKEKRRLRFTARV